MKVSVSILKEINNYKEAIEKVEESNADYLHLDILDNTYIDKKSFSYDMLKNIKYKKKLDIHLMSNNLDELIDKYSTLKPEFITIHEEVGKTINYINKIKEKGIKVGLAINPNTDIEKVYPYLELVDLILIMSVIPGKGGQSFIMDCIGKVQELKEIKDNYNFQIEVDGGINSDTIKYINLYADIVVSGSYITNSNNYNKNIEMLK